MFWVTAIACIVAITATAISYFLFRIQTDPEIIVYTKHDSRRPTVIMIIIENIGKSVARDITFISNKPIPGKAWGMDAIPPDKQELMTSGPLIQGIASLEPGGRRELDWGQFAGLKSSIGDGEIEVIARYKAKRIWCSCMKKYDSKSILEIDSYSGTSALKSELKGVQDELAKIEKELKVISKSLKPLTVCTCDKRR